MTSREEQFLQYHNRGIDLKQEGRYREAIKNLEKALMYFKEPDTYNALAKNYFIIGMYDKSISCFTDGFVREYTRWLKNAADVPNPKFTVSLNHYGYAYTAAEKRLADKDKIYYLSCIDPYHAGEYASVLRQYSLPSLKKMEELMIRTGFTYCEQVCIQIGLPQISRYFQIGI